MSYQDIRDKLVQLPRCPWGSYQGSYVVSDIFPVKHALLQQECPNATSVFEFGALMGHFLVTALDACPLIAHAGWCDSELHTPGSNQAVVENIEHYLTAIDPGGRDVGMDWTDRVRGVPATLGEAPVDVVHVDGEHTYHGCLIDLTLALAMRPRLLLVDDYQAIGEVRTATNDFAAYMGLEVEELVTVNGLAVMRP